MKRSIDQSHQHNPMYREAEVAKRGTKCYADRQEVCQHYAFPYGVTGLDSFFFCIGSKARWYGKRRKVNNRVFRAASARADVGSPDRFLCVKNLCVKITPMFYLQV